MATITGQKNHTCSGDDFVQPGATDTTVQLVISLALGFFAFLTFCVRRASFATLSFPFLSMSLYLLK